MGAMYRTRISTTVDATRLRTARELVRGRDSELFDKALALLIDHLEAVPLGSAEGVQDGCVANLDNVQLLSTSRLLRRAGRVDVSRWAEFCRAVARMMACRA